MLELLLPSLFKVLTLATALAVVSLRNAVHAVLCLVLVFCNVAGLLFFLGSEFLAMVLVVVYVGAIAVLFLFVVMMLDVKVLEQRRPSLAFFPLGGFLCLFFAQLFFGLFYGSFVGEFSLGQPSAVPLPDFSETNLSVLGSLLYSFYFPFFLVSGLVLLVAMVGSIVLTFHHQPATRRQSVADQVFRRPAVALVRFSRLACCVGAVLSFGAGVCPWAFELVGQCKNWPSASAERGFLPVVRGLAAVDAGLPVEPVDGADRPWRRPFRGSAASYAPGPGCHSRPL